jgi:non-specific serine/threonine protein kinase
VQLTSFVGRDQELAEADKLLAGCRLLTLTGVGGAGKTRLSLQVAADAIDEFNDGAWLVELAPVADPELLPNTVAQVLGVKRQPERTIIDDLTAHLQQRRLLLILDNCEHLTAAAAGLSDQLLRHCPDLKIMATSREMLGVPGEVAYLVRSMATPDPDDVEPSGLRRFDAIRLFEERATVVQPEFRVTADNAAAVATVCRRLDGMPLAVELAAARIRLLTPAQIASRLDDRFRLLTGGSRTVLPRQQTLEAAIDWSYELLDKPERLLFARLSVFAGGFTLEDAEHVCADEDLDAIEVLDLVSHLADKSLVVVDADFPGGARYRMLETLRQYAEKKLAGSGIADTVRHRHAEHFATAVATVRREDIQQEHQLARLTADHDNIRAALRWCAESGRIETGLRLAYGVWYFWHVRGFWREGLDWFDRLLDTGQPVAPAIRARALHAAGTIASTLGDLEGAAERLEAAIAFSREMGEWDRVAASLNNLAAVLESRGDYGGARALYEEALALSDESEVDRQREVVLQNLGWTAATLGELDEAEDRFGQALRLAREKGLPVQVSGAMLGMSLVTFLRGDHDGSVRLIENAMDELRGIEAVPFQAGALIALAGAQVVRGDTEKARAALIEAYPLVRELDSPTHIAWWLRNTARFDALVGRHDLAAPLLGAEASIRGETIVALWDRPYLDACIESVRDALGDETFGQAFAAGVRLDRAEALDTGFTGLGK